MKFDFNGLLGNPLLQTGLGILANNTGNYGQFLPAVGRGGLQGLQNAQNFQTQQSFQDYRNQQASTLKKEQDRKEQQFQLQEDAIKQASELFPDKAPLFRLDPSAAIKAVYPSANGADPYFQAVSTDSGLGKFNARTGDFELVNNPVTGKPYIKAPDSPTLQGEIAGAKAEKAGNFKPSNIIDGQILTETQIANMARGNKPQPSNEWQVPPAVQQQRDTGRTTILQQELATEQAKLKNAKTPQAKSDAARNVQLLKQELGGMGIKIPTKAEEAAAVERAKQGVGLEVDKRDGVRTADKFLSVAEQAKTLLEQAPTGSGIGAVADTLGRAVGYTSDSAQTASRLESVSGWMVSNVPRMEGPQSDFDVKNYKTMAGQVGDRTVPVKERKAALDEVIRLQEKYKDLNGGSSGASGDFSDIPKIKGNADYNALPSGATYLDPFGKKRIKK